jgi:hypothetical protein
MIIGKRELTPEEIAKAKEALARRRATPKTKVSSQSFVDRMTSATADPDARDESGESREADGEKSGR